MLYDWENKFYEKVFKETYDKLITGKRQSPAVSLEEIKDILTSLYVLDGNNWIGRGLIGDITSAATIAAYESFISEQEQQEK